MEEILNCSAFVLIICQSPGGEFFKEDVVKYQRKGIEWKKRSNSKFILFSVCYVGQLEDRVMILNCGLLGHCTL